MIMVTGGVKVIDESNLASPKEQDETSDGQFDLPPDSTTRC